jgi:hypothetical protein
MLSSARRKTHRSNRRAVELQGLRVSVDDARENREGESGSRLGGGVMPGIDLTSAGVLRIICRS